MQADGYTRDFSNGGIFLYTKSKIATGSNLEIVLILPAEFTHSEKRWVCCQASVVRVESAAEGAVPTINGANQLLLFLRQTGEDLLGHRAGRIPGSCAHRGRVVLVGKMGKAPRAPQASMATERAAEPL